MKASQVIRDALANHYTMGRRSDYSGEVKTAPFMCHAVEFALTGDFGNDNHPDTSRVEEVNETIMVKLRAKGKGTLIDFLNATDAEYQETFASTGTHYGVECFDLRVKWIKAHIADLESQGL